MLTALADRERGLGDYHAQVDPEALDHIARIANGDARAALNAIELAVRTTKPVDGVIHITVEIAGESIQKKVMKCDEQQYYDMLSAFCKSLRGGDSDAAIAWFARLIYGGVDPRIICRRLIAHASEDIGLANPQAMVQAVAAAQALELIGLPEARLSIIQAIIFCAKAPSPTRWSWPWTRPFGMRRPSRTSRCPSIFGTPPSGGRTSWAMARDTNTLTTFPAMWWSRNTCPPA